MLCPRRCESLIPPFAPEHDEWRVDGTCSWCGSIAPDKFMELARAGVELGPTDKTYKVYVDAAATARGGRKFYFQHLSEEQRREFVELLRDGKLTIGFPGRFYVLPFFIRMGPPE